MTGYRLLVIVFVTVTTASAVAILFGLRWGQQENAQAWRDNVHRSRQPLSRGVTCPLQLAQRRAESR